MKSLSTLMLTTALLLNMVPLLPESAALAADSPDSPLKPSQANPAINPNPADVPANPTLTRNNGSPVGDNQNSQTAGPGGPVLLQDTHLLEKLAAFDRERIPERVVHARGVGAHGEFESFADLSDLTMAAPLTAKGKKTPTFVRFSTVINPSGSPEGLRDPRGFAVRFFSDQGNWDLVGNNLPVFFIRDAMKFPDVVHAFKPSPVTNLQDPNRIFDFFAGTPEGTAMLTYLYSDLGIPKNYRHMDGFGVNAFKFVNRQGEFKYVKFNWHSRQGVVSLTGDQATTLRGKDFNFATRDLYTAIAGGDFPSWDLYIQVLDPKKLDSFDFNPLDDTKIWPVQQVPEQLVGRLTLNRMPDNFFNETERYAPAVSNLIPGVEASEDRMLQGRLFSYADTQRYRLGINHQQFPINAPQGTTAFNHNQQGEGRIKDDKEKGDTNYQPSRLGKGGTEDTAYKASRLPLTGTTQQQPIAKTLNFKQAGELYRSFTKMDQDHLITNLAGDLGQVSDLEIKLILNCYFYKADKDYGTRLAKAIGVNLEDVKKRASALKD